MRSQPLAPRRLLLASFFVLLVGIAPVAMTQTMDDPLSRVETGMEEGDPVTVLADARGRVEVVLFGEGGMYRRAQATHVLRDFFRRHPPSRMEFQDRTSSDDGQTAIGSYETESGGTPLSVRVLHRETADGWELVSIRIDRWSAVRVSGR